MRPTVTLPDDSPGRAGSPPRHLALVGSTATGKSALAMAMARHRPDVEIVSADSMQVYRGMDIGTAKPTPAERAEVPHHLLDLADPSEEFSVGRFQAAARQALAAVEARGHHGLLVGGTGLYLRAVVDDLDLPGRWPERRAQLEAESTTPELTAALHARLAALDPVAASRMEPTNRRRVVRALEVTLGSGRPYSSFGPGLGAYPPSPVAQVGLRLRSETLDARIVARFEAMLGAGLLDEVRALAARSHGFSRTARQALGYRELLAHLAGELPLAEAAEEAVRRTRGYARRQHRWFRRDPRIAWVDVDVDVDVDAGIDAGGAVARNPLAVVADRLGGWAA